MFGGSSIQLARVFGIRIGIETSWFLVLFLVIFFLTDYYGGGSHGFVLATISALLFFLSVLLHELGHAVVAMRGGIAISGIDLWMFGGVAKMERDTRSPGEEFRVAVAGPLVTLLIAGACFAALALLLSSADEGLRAIFFTGEGGDAEEVLAYLSFINFVLLVFNLIPGFPLDGGRIARAIAWWLTGDRNRATFFAARLGRGFAFLMIATGVFFVVALGALVSGIWFAFIGVFLGQAARSAEYQSVITSRIEGLRVEDVMDSEPVAVPASLTLDRALDEYFLRYRWPWFPVVDASGRLVGLVSHEGVQGMPETLRPTRTVASVMAADTTDSGSRVDVEEPLEALLGREALSRLGAIMAVDRDGVLRGVVTVDQVRRALSASVPAPS